MEIYWKAHAAKARHAPWARTLLFAVLCSDCFADRTVGVKQLGNLSAIAPVLNFGSSSSVSAATKEYEFLIKVQIPKGRMGRSRRVFIRFNSRFKVFYFFAD
jgi:hypothetical protein